MLCNWEYRDDAHGWRCRTCGLPARPRSVCSRYLCRLPAYRHCVTGPPIETPSRGLGDTIAKITNAVGIKPCGGCKKRQKKLNKMFPYK